MNCSTNSHGMESYNSTGCDSCPFCKKGMETYIMPVIKIGIIQFLVHTFITESDATVITPEKLIKQLSQFAEVGKRVYGRRVNGSPASIFRTSTIFQIIAARLVTIVVRNVDEKKTVCL